MKNSNMVTEILSQHSQILMQSKIKKKRKHTSQTKNLLWYIGFTFFSSIEKIAK